MKVSSLLKLWLIKMTLHQLSFTSTSIWVWSLAHGQQLWMWMLTGQSSVSVALHTEYCIRCVTASSVRLVRRWSNRGVSRWHELRRETASPVPRAPMCFEGILRSCYQFCSHWQSTVWRSSTELTREMGGKNWWAQRMPSESVSRHSFAVRLCELREDFPCVPLLAWAVCAVHQTLEEERSSSCFLLCVCVCHSFSAAAARWQTLMRWRRRRSQCMTCNETSRILVESRWLCLYHN